MKQLVKLKDIAKYSKGSQINGENLINGAEFDYLNGGINPSGKWNEANCVANTITISEGGNSCGYVNFMSEPFWCGAHCYYLYDTAKNSKYIYYALKSQQDRIMKLRSGACMPNIKKGDLGNFEFYFDDDVNEQETVTLTLSKLEKIIESRKMELSAFDELIKSRFVEMFGDLANPECLWNKHRLIEACADKDDIKCGPFGTQLSKNEYMESGIAVWEIPQINTAFRSRPTHFITSKKAEQLKAYTIIPGDIAMSRKGNVGKCAIFPEKYSTGIIHSDVLRIRLNSRLVNPMFMMCQLHFSGAVTRQIELVSSGAIMAGVNVTKLKQIYVHVPPIELQNQFADFVRGVDKSKLHKQMWS